MNTKFPRGSEWRKWDLHVHTPASGMANQYGDDWDRYVKELFTRAIERQVAVIGITDYFTIEGYEKIKTDYLNNDAKLLELFKTQEMVRKVRSILLLPNVEFRLETLINNRRVNYHVIFSDEVSIQDIKENFLGEIEFVRESMPFEGDDVSKISRHNIEDLGRKIKAEQPSFDGNDFSIGCKVAAVQASQIKKVLDRHKNIFADKYLIGIPVDEDLSSIGWKSQEHNVRKTLYQQCAFFFSSNENTRQFGLGKKHQSEQAYLEEFKTFKPCIIGSDAHSFDQLNRKLGIYSDTDESKITWIKADTTFNGLRQIVFEPEERVRIQSDDPTIEKEKSPFTRILIPEQTPVFIQDDEANGQKSDVAFDSCDLLLNSNLVSIIGGRGTGKSILVDYIAAAFNKDTAKKNFNLDSSVKIFRQASLSEAENEFAVSEHPNVPFMYICQSQIKKLVEDSSRFTKNILSTIGVADDYSMDFDYVEKAGNAIAEYIKISDIFNLSEKSPAELKLELDEQIKKYEDFIRNITSEENKIKLRDYKEKVRQYSAINNKINEIKHFVAELKLFSEEKNKMIQGWNEFLLQINVVSDIPLIDVLTTTNYLETNILSALETQRIKVAEAIENTKNDFRNYKGDLTTLLSNVSVYQTKLTELSQKKENLNKQEGRLVELSNTTFAELGRMIVKSLKDYVGVVKAKWEEFRGCVDGVGEEKKILLKTILQEDLNVEAEIVIDLEKMRRVLMDELDHRSYNDEKISRCIKISNIDDFYAFITLQSETHVFSECIRADLRKRILQVFYRDYTSFVRHHIKVTLNGRPITKLSYGQQGTIYLRLQIAANMFSETIIYDQPEDDLDNEFIIKELVNIFRVLKKHRQIIIVSHNANLVVNADSEQVIVAHNNDGVLSYTSGSLENPEINKAVCQILEGGKRAFENREQKYNL